MEITKDQFKEFLIHYHGLDEKQLTVLDYFRRVGCIQYDPLNIVGRNPDLVLQSRIQNYTSHQLHTLLYEEYSLVDGWDKMMSIYQMEDFPYFERVRKSREKETINTLKYRNSLESLEYVDEVLQLINDTGPKYSKDVDVGLRKESVWGHKKVSSAVLDYLYTKGELAVVTKNNTQKQYDLTERVLPARLLEEIEMTDEEFYEWYILRRIGSNGIYWNKNGGGWLGHFISKKNNRTNVIKSLLSQNLLTEVTVEGVLEKFYVKTSDLHFFNLKLTDRKVRMIAPLDNLIWDRDLIKIIFDFDYSWEVYKPKNKRVYGYYVLPVLYGSDLVGRIEFENFQEGELIIKNFWIEHELDHLFYIKLEEELESFKDYLGATDIKNKAKIKEVK
jgi:uncharacterized protein YcaQ